MVAPFYIFAALFLAPFMTGGQTVHSATATDVPLIVKQAQTFAHLEKQKKTSRLSERRFERWKRAGASPREIKPLTFQEDQNKRTRNAVGVYLTPSSVKRTEFLDETMQNVLDAGGNSIVFDVKGSYVYFDADAKRARELDLIRPSYNLQEVLAKAREKNIYTIGRFISIKDNSLTARRPDLLAKDPKTGRKLSEGWVDPSNPFAIEYNAEIMCELARSGIDEVNMDYIRFSTAYVGDLNVFSRQEKAERVETFIKAMREAINRCGPQTKLGASTYAILGWAYDVNVETLGQDVILFAPLLDVISPMAYPATFAQNAYYIPGKHPRSRMYYLVYRTLSGYRDMLGPEQAKKLRPWIQGYSVSARDVKEQIDGVMDAGACGFQFWNAGNNYAAAYAGMKMWKRPDKCE